MPTATDTLQNSLPVTAYQALIILADRMAPMSGRMVAAQLDVVPTTANAALNRLRDAGLAGASRQGRADLWHLVMENPLIVAWLQERRGGTEGEAEGMSPYATGGGGVTFERKVAARYLGALLTGEGAPELGEGRHVVEVSFQQAPEHTVDDLVISAARDGEATSLVLTVAVRRSPNLVKSDESTQELVRAFVREVGRVDKTEVEHRVALLVAGEQHHARQLGVLADHAAKQSTADGFFDLIRAARKFERPVVDRLAQIEGLVKGALGRPVPDAEVVRVRTWNLLSNLTVLFPRFEAPDASDWADLANRLAPHARGLDLFGASRLRDRLEVLASGYAPAAARVDLTVLRRDAHDSLATQPGADQTGAPAVAHLDERARAAVRAEIRSGDGERTLHLDRSNVVVGLRDLARTSVVPIVVVGESGVGKSSLVIRTLIDEQEQTPDGTVVLCVNLRQLPVHTIDLESYLGAPLVSLLARLSAPRRLLVVDGADAIAEDKLDTFRYLADASARADVVLVAITANDVKQLVRDEVAKRSRSDVAVFVVPPLTDTEIDAVVAEFPELADLAGGARSRELLRRPVVVDLLVRGDVSGTPLSDADAMHAVWAGLVRRHEQTGHGTADARALALLRLADLALRGGNALEVLSSIDPAALVGLRRDGLLQSAGEDDPFSIGPEFAHDEVRRYAIARVLLDGGDPTVKLIEGKVPRWALGAARLACQELLSAEDGPRNPLRGRFARVQTAFDRLTLLGHGERWGDVPGEALLTIGDPRPVLRDAWTDLRGEGGGLERLSRLVEQRLRDQDGFVRITAVEPLIDAMLDDEPLFWSHEHLERVVREWLRSLVVTRVPEGEPLRVRLRDRLVAACVAADRHLAERRAEEAARLAARTLEEVEADERWAEERRGLWRALSVSHSPRTRRRRDDLPGELTDEALIEILALLGPDLGAEGEEILRRVAINQPWSLCPALEELFCGTALSMYRRGFLAELAEAYYLDDEEDGSWLHDFGIRDHLSRSFGITPLAAWYRGPFMPLFQSDFRNGVAMLNRLLNHAANTRARNQVGLYQYGGPVDQAELDRFKVELDIAGDRRHYVGDGHVWCWYRGTAFGPYPCISALQALERVCDQLVGMGMPISNLVAMLMDGCENLAMVGLLVGVLVRHLDEADRLLDPFLVEPAAWNLEFSRLANENSGLAAPSDELVSPERRQWSLREAATWLVLHADEDRAEELRALGDRLVQNAHRLVAAASGDEEQAAAQEYFAVVRNWASGLDRASYEARQGDDGNLYFQSRPPEDVVQSMEQGNEEVRRSHEAVRLFVRYYLDPRKDDFVAPTVDEIVGDLATATELLENPPALNAGDPWDTAVTVSAYALSTALHDDADLPDEALRFAAEVVLKVGEGAPPEREYDIPESYFEQGGDRIAAGVIPLLLLPVAAEVRALVGRDGEIPTSDRVRAAANDLAQRVANEVRLHLARGMDAVWATPCETGDRCHHRVAVDLLLETVRDSVFGPSDGYSRRSRGRLSDPVIEELALADGDKIDFSRFDAAIRGLAPAAMADVCVSAEARETLLALLATQRRSMLAYERNMDRRGSQALIAARALLTLARDGDDAPVYEHIDAFADDATLLNSFLRALSAAAEESLERAETARRIWSTVAGHVFDLDRSGHTPFDGRHDGDYARAALLPNAAGEAMYLYPELDGAPQTWWNPTELVETVEAWLPGARRVEPCLDQLISFLRPLSLVEQARLGVRWVAELVLAGPDRVVRHSFFISTWLIEIRSEASDCDLLPEWQRMVDALVVAGASRLAPYSE